MSTEKGAHTVEVVTTFGDSVVAIEHCGTPTRSSAYRAFVAVSVTCLCMSAFAFWRGIETARANRADGIYQVEVLKRPAFAIRARQLDPVYDGLAFGGLFAAIVAGAAAFALRGQRPRASARVGDAVVSRSARGFAFSAPGHESVDPIPADAKLRVDVGAATVFVTALAHPAERLSLVPRATDRRMIAFVTGSLAAHALAWILVELAPPETAAPKIELGHLETTAATTKTAQTSPPPPKPAEERRNDPDEGAAIAMSLKQDRRMPALGQAPRAKDRISAPPTRGEAMQAARSAGVLGAVARSSFSAIIGTTDISDGFDDTNIYGGLLGNEAGEMNGGFGFGRSGFGPDKGGTGWGTIGTGRYGTIGHGSGTGSGYGVGGGRYVRPPPPPRLPTLTLDVPHVPGGYYWYYPYIRRYLKRHIQKLMYCYEKKLLASPGLAGTVTATFVILPSGVVSAASAAGVDDEVSQCVADVIKAIEFPKLKDGETVKVVYPLAFHPAGQ